MRGVVPRGRYESDGLTFLSCKDCAIFKPTCFVAGELRPNFRVFHGVSYFLGGVFRCFSQYPWCVLRHLEGIPSELHHLLSQDPPSIVHLHLTTVQVIDMQVELFDADPVVWVPHHFLEGTGIYIM